MAISLLDLPNEILLYIARFLPDQEDVSDFSRTNRHLHAVIDSYLYQYNVRYDNAYALTFGAYKGRRAVVEKALAAKPPDINAPPYRQLTRSWTSHNALCNAIKGQHSDLVELLLDHGSSPHHGCRARLTPLMMAAQYGNVESMRMLIERGASVHDRNSLNQDALYFAAARGEVGFIRLLLKHGAVINPAGENAETPLHLVAKRGDSASVRVLLRHGADVTAIDAGGRTPLCAAARSGDVPCVELLLRCGADYQLSTDTGRMALFDAVSCGKAEVARLFLDRGVPLECKEELMNTTTQAGYLVCLDIVLCHGGDVDCRNPYQETPLLLAVRYGRIELVERLLDAGADIHALDFKGQSPLSLARANVDKRLEHILLRRGQCRSTYV